MLIYHKYTNEKIRINVVYKIKYVTLHPLLRVSSIIQTIKQ